MGLRPTLAPTMSCIDWKAAGSVFETGSCGLGLTVINGYAFAGGKAVVIVWLVAISVSGTLAVVGSDRLAELPA